MGRRSDLPEFSDVVADVLQLDSRRIRSSGGWLISIRLRGGLVSMFAVAHSEVGRGEEEIRWGVAESSSVDKTQFTRTIVPSQADPRATTQFNQTYGTISFHKNAASNTIAVRLR